MESASGLVILGMASMQRLAEEEKEKEKTRGGRAARRRARCGLGLLNYAPSFRTFLKVGKWEAHASLGTAFATQNDYDKVGSKDCS